MLFSIDFQNYKFRSKMDKGVATFALFRIGFLIIYRIIKYSFGKSAR